MNKLQELSKNTFENKEFMKELQNYVNDNTTQTWLTTKEWKELLTRLYQINFDDWVTIKHLKIMAHIDENYVEDDGLYSFNSELDRYEPVSEKEIKNVLIGLRDGYIVDAFEEDYKDTFDNNIKESQFYEYLKKFYEDNLNEVKTLKNWFNIKDINNHYKQIKKNLIDSKESYFANPFNSKYKYILFDLITNPNLTKGVWYEYVGGGIRLKEVNEELIKQYALLMIEYNKEWNSEFSNLRKRNKEKFKEFDRYLDNKLNKIFSNSLSR